MSERAKKDPLRSGAEIAFGAGAVSAMSADATMATLGKVFGTGGGSFGLTRLTAMLAPILDIATRSDIMPPTETGKRLAGMHADKFDALADIADSERAAAIYGDSDPTYLAQLKAMNDAKRAKIESELTDLGYAGPGVPGRGMYAGQYSIADIQRATGIGGSAEPVKAEVVGNATLETTVKVEPSPDFLTRIEQTVHNAINAFRSSGGPATGSAGSTGQSMPEAGPPM
jgi:hypothetical protein